MNGLHHYALTTKWTGNNGEGTSHYRVYERSHSIISGNKPVILASSDPAFRGDPTKYNPEELLVASLSGCHIELPALVCHIGHDRVGLRRQRNGHNGGKA